MNAVRKQGIMFNKIYFEGLFKYAYQRGKLSQ